MIKMSNSIQMYKPGLEDIHPYLYPLSNRFPDPFLVSRNSQQIIERRIKPQALYISFSGQLGRQRITYL